MSIMAMAGRLVTVRRRTALVRDPIGTAASLAVSRQPVVPSMIEVRVSGNTACTGTVTVSGTVNAVPDSEVLTFTAPASKRTVKRFSALSGFTTTGFADLDETEQPTLQAEAVGADGSRQHAEYVVVSGVPAHQDRGRTSWPSPMPGSAQVEETWFAVEYDDSWTPREGDLIVDEGPTAARWLVVGVPDYLGALSPDHWEVRVRRREGT